MEADERQGQKGAEMMVNPMQAAIDAQDAIWEQMNADMKTKLQLLRDCRVIVAECLAMLNEDQPQWKP